MPPGLAEACSRQHYISTAIHQRIGEPGIGQYFGCAVDRVTLRDAAQTDAHPGGQKNAISGNLNRAVVHPCLGGLHGLSSGNFECVVKVPDVTHATPGDVESSGGRFAVTNAALQHLA